MNSRHPVSVHPGRKKSADRDERAAGPPWPLGRPCTALTASGSQIDGQKRLPPESGNGQPKTRFACDRERSAAAGPSDAETEAARSIQHTVR